MNFWVIFLTGLTTGGLTCLAVQGGLLATALARQIRVSAPPQPNRDEVTGRNRSTITGIQLTDNPLPVVYFLIAKLLAHTILGFLLGGLGASFQLTPTLQAIFMFVAGLFMLATALNMFNVHPIFRYTVLQPPKALTRLVRNQAKSQEAFTPVLLGLMTVFIPCGTTQAMEVLALSSGSPLIGAAIMFFFVMGTWPTFFVLGFLASRLRGRVAQTLAITTAFLVLGLGFVSLNSALTLLGSPLAPSRILASILPSDSRSSKTPVQAIVADGVQEITLTATNNGYSPSAIIANHGQPIRLRLVTNNNYGCTNAFLIPSLGIREFLPFTGTVVVDVPPQQTGTLYFTCGMGMYGGTISIA